MLNAPDDWIVRCEVWWDITNEVTGQQPSEWCDGPGHTTVWVIPALVEDRGSSDWEYFLLTDGCRCGDQTLHTSLPHNYNYADGLAWPFPVTRQARHDNCIENNVCSEASGVFCNKLQWTGTIITASSQEEMWHTLTLTRLKLSFISSNGRPPPPPPP